VIQQQVAGISNVFKNLQQDVTTVALKITCTQPCYFNLGNKFLQNNVPALNIMLRIILCIDSINLLPSNSSEELKCDLHPFAVTEPFNPNLLLIST